MSNMLMVFPNRAAQPTVWAPAGWVTSGPLTLQALRTRQLRHVARTLNTDARHTFFHLDAGAAIVVGAVVLENHNLPTTGQWRLRGFAVDPKPLVEGAFCWPVVPAGFSFSRSGVARYFGADRLNASAGNNTLRVQHDAVTGRARGLLVEGSGTNYLQYCRATTGWTVTNGTLAQTATGIDGVANAALLLTATSAACTLKRTPSGAPAAGAVLSVWVYGVVVTGLVELSIDDFATTTTVAVIVGQWVRVSMQGTYGAAAVGIRLAAFGDSVRLDFFQHEAGLDNVPTSEILTTSTSASRSSDSLTIADVTALGLTPASMTMVLRLRMVRRTGVGEDNIIGLGAGGGDFIGLSVNASGATFARVNRSGTDEAHIAGPVLAPGDYITVAMTWASNNVRVSFDGGAVLADTSATLPSLTAWAATVTSSAAFELERVLFWNGQLADAELQCLSGHGEDISRIPDFDSGMVDAWPAAYVSGTTAEERAGMPADAPYLPATPQTYRHWRISMHGEDLTAPYRQLGRVLMGDAWQVEENPAYGEVTLGYLDRDLVAEAEGGSEYFTRRNSPRVVRFPLRMMRESEAFGRALEMLRQLGTSGEMFWMWDPDDTRWRPLRSMACRLRTLSPVEAAMYGRFAMAIELRQLL